MKQNKKDSKPNPIDKYEMLVYTPTHISQLLGVSLSATYEFLKIELTKQDFVVRKIGKQYRVDRTSFDRWISPGSVA